MNLERGVLSRLNVIRKVEILVCRCTNLTFDVAKKGRHIPVSVCTLYDGVTNIPITRRLARCALFVVLHDRFGISYSDLSKHSSISSNSIMASVRKYKNLLQNDDVVKKINELIDIELQKFPIV